MRYSSIILGDVEQFLFFFPPLCVCFAANSSVANKSQVYLLQHDKSSRHADTGLVETKWAQENRKNKKIKKNYALPTLVWVEVVNTDSSLPPVWELEQHNKNDCFLKSSRDVLQRRKKLPWRVSIDPGQPAVFLKYRRLPLVPVC